MAYTDKINHIQENYSFQFDSQRQAGQPTTVLKKTAHDEQYSASAENKSLKVHMQHKKDPPAFNVREQSLVDISMHDEKDFFNDCKQYPQSVQSFDDDDVFTDSSNVKNLKRQTSNKFSDTSGATESKDKIVREEFTIYVQKSSHSDFDFDETTEYEEETVYDEETIYDEETVNEEEL